jgi:hypothetical protein
MANVAPFWVSANLQSIGPAGNEFTHLLDATRGLLDGVKTPLQSTATKARDVNQRLATWYNQQVQQGTEVQALTDAAANFLDSAWTSGVHWYIMRPDFGGFGRVLDTIGRGITAPDSDLSAPDFADDAYAGGVLVLFAGPPEALFDAAIVLLLMLTGDTEAAGKALSDLLGTSPALGSVSDAFSDLVSLPEDLWDSATTRIKSAFEASPIAKIVNGDVYPLNLLKAGSFNIDAVTPSSVKPDEAVVISVKGQGFDLQDFITVDDHPQATAFIDENTLQCQVLPSQLGAGDHAVAVTHKGAKTDAGTLTVEAPTIFDALSTIGDPAMWNVWHAITVGDSLNKLVPGAGSFVDKTIATLDLIGEGAVAAQNLGQVALATTGNTIADGADRAANLIDSMDDGVADFLASILSLSASIMVIPPVQGGNHQLNYALHQGLSGFAANAPIVTDDDAVFAAFFCAGGERTVVNTALNTVATVLNIQGWQPLA